MTQGTLNRRYYKSIGRCPRCNGKNKLMEGENVCPDCQVKAYEQSLKRDKEHYNKMHREWEKKRYEKRKENGLCTRCGKHKPKEGQLRCEYCIAKYSASRDIKDYHLSRFERGLCRWCDNPVENGYRVCEYHHQMQIEKSRKSKQKCLS